MKISEVWKALENGKTVHWVHEGYSVFRIPAKEKGETGYEYQQNHHSFKNGEVLIIRHIEGHQSLIGESELDRIYIKD